MLHNTTREQLLQQGRGYVALVIDAAYFLGWKEYHAFTYVEIVELLSSLNIPKKALQIALRDPAFGRIGRRNRHFLLPAVSSLRKAVQGNREASESDELREEDFRSLRAYRMALHHSLIVRRPGHYLRALLAKRLGVCKSTTRNYDRELGHIVTSAYRFFPLTDELLERLPEEKPSRQKYFLFIRHAKNPFFAPLLRQIAIYWRAQGVDVQIVQQMGSLYEVSEGSFARTYWGQPD